MSDIDYSSLCESVCEIYHCAADVRHYASDFEPYLKTNVGGTENMVELAKKANAKFYHISTCSVCGNSLKNSSDHVDFTENDFDIGQIWEKNIYVKSKYLAEKVVFDAISDGLNAKIFRLGRLVGRDSDGKFQKNPESNAFYLTVKGFKQIGAIPFDVENAGIDLMPIDRSAKQVLLLKDSSDTVFHIMNPIPPSLGEIMNSVNPNNRIVKMKEFFDILKEQAPNLEGHLFGVVMDAVRSNAISKQITVTNNNTVDALKKNGYVNEAVDVSVVLKEFD
jgi:surfactin family lipopeptide synthetase A